MEKLIFGTEESTVDVVTEIVNSTYMHEYYMLFLLMIIGYFTIDYFAGYITGKIHFVKKIFNYRKTLSVLIILPIFIDAISVIYSLVSTDLGAEEFMFTSIWASVSSMLFIYAGSKQHFEKSYDIKKLFADYAYPIGIISFVSIVYIFAYLPNDRSELQKEIRTKINEKRRLLGNKEDFELANMVVSHLAKETEQLTAKLKDKQQSIIEDMNNRIASNEAKYVSLTENIDAAQSNLESLNQNYKQKILIVDTEIDEEKLRLKEIYKEWQNNIDKEILEINSRVDESGIGNKLDSLAHMLSKQEQLIKKRRQTISLSISRIDSLLNLNDFNVDRLSEQIKKIPNVRPELNYVQSQIDSLRGSVKVLNQENKMSQKSKNVVLKKNLSKSEHAEVDSTKSHMDIKRQIGDSTINDPRAQIHIDPDSLK